MSNPFHNRAGSTAGPGIDYAPVTPSDTDDFTNVAVALYVENGGAVSFVSAKGTTRTVIVPDYGYILCGVRRVAASGTTAAGIHAITVT